jgi:hypothetical protein
MENDISQEPGMYYTPARGQNGCECQSNQENTQKPPISCAPQFHQGWEVALGLHLLEEAN